MIGSDLNLNHQTTHGIFSGELGMRKICAKLVPKILTNEKGQPKECERTLFEHVENDENVSNMS